MKKRQLIKAAQVGLHFLMSMPPEYLLMAYLAIRQAVKKKK